MKSPTIGDARAICERLGARAVIVIALTRDDLAGVSYGQTKRECGQVGHALDRICKAIEDGRLKVWEDAV